MKKNTKIIIGVFGGVFLFIIISALGFYIGFNKEEYIEYITLGSDRIHMYCSNDDPASDETIYHNSMGSSYGVGDYVYCKVWRGGKPHYHQKVIIDVQPNENMELVDVYSLNNEWDISFDENNVTLKSLKLEPKFDDDNEIILKFYIKDNKNIGDGYKIKLNSLKLYPYNLDYVYYVKDGLTYNLGKQYKYISTIIDGKVISYKLQSDGSYSKVSELDCNDCGFGLYGIQSSNYYPYNDEIILLKQGSPDGPLLLYNREKGNIINSYGKRAYLLRRKDDKIDDFTYFYIADKDNNNYGIIDKEGNIIKDFVLSGKELDYFMYGGIFNIGYSIENDMLVALQNDKYGVIRITTDDVLIDYKYDSIRLFNDKYFKAKIDDKWYLYSFETKDKVTDEGYDQIIKATDDILIVDKGQYLYIKDYKGNNLINDKIEDMSDKYDDIVYGVSNPEIKVSVENDIITISTISDDYWSSHAGLPFDDGEGYNIYEYNITKNTLTKIK